MAVLNAEAREVLRAFGITQAAWAVANSYADGRWHAYHDGMHSTAEGRVRSESIVLALVSGLKAVFGSKHEEGKRSTSAR